LNQVDAELRLSHPETGIHDVLCGGVALGQVVEQHWNAVYRLLYRLSGSSHDAEDLTQETFLRAFERRDSFRPGTNMRAWLMRIASNAFFDLHRKRRAAKATTLDDEQAHAAPPPTGPAETAELGGLLAEAIARLPETSRLVFLMRSTEDLSFREIAEAIGASEETARWHMLQARRRLLERLDGKL
jgi:RNA polymerase sigma-70 factor (ECF subfamily)